MALVGVTDIPEFSRTVVSSVFLHGSDWLCDQNTRIGKTTANHTMAIPVAHHWSIAIVV
jgi:hypothetical protein